MADVPGSSQGLSKGLIVVGAVVVAIVLAIGFCVMMRFSLINKDEAVKARWADVQNVYQRRADLIPNLVATVKGAAKFESTTHKDIVDAQNKLLAIHKEFEKSLSAQDPAQVERRYAELMDASKRFMESTVTAFPELKGVAAFQDLQAQIEGSENRIAVERRNYNAAVQEYNASSRKWTWLPLCGGFATRATFEAREGADQPPAVNF